MDKQYIGYARKAANAILRCHYLPPHLRDEVHSQALLLLVKHAPRYDPTRGASPETYLVKKIRLALIDWLRQETGFKHRTPRPDMVSLEDLTETMLAGTSKEDPPWLRATRADALRRLREIVGEKHWPVIQAWLEGRTLQWAGEQMGVSESRASQIRDALFTRLRNSSVAEILEGVTA